MNNLTYKNRNLLKYIPPLAFSGKVLAQLSQNYGTLNAQLSQNYETLNEILKELQRLELEPNEEDFINRPTLKVAETVKKLIANAYIKKNDLPKPLVSPDGDGGLSLEWKKGEKEIKLFVRVGSKEPYIYHEQGNSYDIVPKITADDFTNWMNWLIR